MSVLQRSIPPPPTSPSPPSDNDLKCSIEQAALHCAANPNFFQVLYAASIAAGSLSRPESSATYNFIFDSNAEGHHYFNWCFSTYQQQLLSQPVLPVSNRTHEGASSSFQCTNLPTFSSQEASYKTRQTSSDFHFYSGHDYTGEPPSISSQHSKDGSLRFSQIPCSALSTAFSTKGVNQPLAIGAQSSDPSCVAIRHRPGYTPTSFHLKSSVQDLAISYQKPPPLLFDLEYLNSPQCDSKTSIVFHKMNEFTQNASVLLVGCLNLEASLNAILPFYPPFIAVNPDYQTACSILRLNTEALQSFVGRLSLSLLSHILMTTGSLKVEWRSHLLPHFPWILRLTYLACCNAQEKAMILSIVQKTFDMGVICHEKRIFFTGFIEAKHIPNVSPVFNTPLIVVSNTKKNDSKKKFRFDTVENPESAFSSVESVTESNESNKMYHGLSLGRFSSIAPVSQAATEAIVSPAPHEPTSPQCSQLSSPHQNGSTLMDTGFIGKDDPAIVAKPDRISGGVLVTFLKQVSKRSRHLQAAFIPYRPLDTFPIPASLSLDTTATEYLLERYGDLQEDINAGFATLAATASRSRFSSTKPSIFRSAFDRHFLKEDKKLEEDSLYMSKKKLANREFKERGSGLTSYAEARWEKPVAWAQAEMGISDDGSLLGKRGSDRLGLGASSKPTPVSAADELYDDYRKQRAHKYHKTIAQAQAERAQEEFKDPSRLCFICQKAGHLAKECKFGLT